jgi:hypothetical protein
MRRFVRGLSIYTYQVFIRYDFQAQLPTGGARGTVSTYPSILNIIVNVMRSKRPKWTSPFAKANLSIHSVHCLCNTASHGF